MIFSMAVFATLGPGASVLVIIVALGLSGLSNGIAMPPISAMIANSAEVRHMGSASAALQVANQVGVVAGIQLMQTVQASREHVAGVVGSFQEAYMAGALVALVAVAATLFIRRIPQAGRALAGRQVTSVAAEVAAEPG
jgi:sugar phosphate permease